MSKVVLSNPASGAAPIRFLPRQTLTHIGGRKPKHILVWTVERQAWAVERGFFVARSDSRNRVVLQAVNPFKPVVDYFNQDQAIGWVLRQTFFLDAGFDVLYDFIIQQDKHGYTGAWDGQVEHFDPQLRWYKNYLAEHAGKRTQYIKDARKKLTTFKKARTKKIILLPDAVRFHRERARLQADAKAQRLEDKARDAELKAYARMRRQAEREARQLGTLDPHTKGAMLRRKYTPK